MPLPEKRGLPTLTPRLAAVAAQVRPGARLLDVGTDHAYLPAYLVGQGICPRAVASDVREGPCARARATVKACNLERDIAVVKTDGLHGFTLEDVDDVVLAGMGGELMLTILEAAPQIRQQRLHLILQPQTDFALVRRRMASWGFALNRELLAAEGHRIYHIFSFTYDGVLRAPDEAAIAFGRPEANRDLLTAYYRKLRSSMLRELEGISRSAAPDEARMETLRKMLHLLSKEEES